MKMEILYADISEEKTYDFLPVLPWVCVLSQAVCGAGPPDRARHSCKRQFQISNRHPHPQKNLYMVHGTHLLIYLLGLWLWLSNRASTSNARDPGL